MKKTKIETTRPIGYRIADIGPGRTEHNVTSKDYPADATVLVVIDNASVLARVVPFLDWARDNKDDPDLVADVGNLSPGEGMMIGGGASPAFTIVRFKKGDV